MDEAFITFERENREGLVAVGTYLIDAAGRFGISLDHDRKTGTSDDHDCEVKIVAGRDLLSPRTRLETEYFAANGRDGDLRLACQTKIERAGDITIMTDEKQSEAKNNESDESNFKKEFEAMPLEKKIANLLQLEFIAFGETMSFVFNSPYKIFDKVLDVMAEFGLKKEEAERRSARPAEHSGGQPPSGSEKSERAGNGS